jgi:hypothetical protein
MEPDDSDIVDQNGFFTFLISRSLNLRRKIKTLNNRNTSLISSGELKLCKQNEVVPVLRTLAKVSLSHQILFLKF